MFSLQLWNYEILMILRITASWKMSTCQKSATYSKDEIFGNDDSDYSMVDLYGVTWLPGGGVRGTPESFIQEGSRASLYKALMLSNPSSSLLQLSQHSFFNPVICNYRHTMKQFTCQSILL